MLEVLIAYSILGNSLPIDILSPHNLSLDFVDNFPIILLFSAAFFFRAPFFVSTDSTSQINPFRKPTESDRRARLCANLRERDGTAHGCVVRQRSNHDGFHNAAETGRLAECLGRRRGQDAVGPRRFASSSLPALGALQTRWRDNCSVTCELPSDRSFPSASQ